MIRLDFGCGLFSLLELSYFRQEILFQSCILCAFRNVEYTVSYFPKLIAHADRAPEGKAKMVDNSQRPDHHSLNARMLIDSWNRCLLCGDQVHAARSRGELPRHWERHERGNVLLALLVCFLHLWTRSETRPRSRGGECGKLRDWRASRQKNV